MPNLCCSTIFAERVTLKPVSSAYEDAIFREFTEAVARYTFPKPADDIEGVRAFIGESRAKMERGTDLVVAVIDRMSGAFLGCAGLHGLDGDEPEFGIWLAVSAQGKGIGKEVVLALHTWAVANLPQPFLRYVSDRTNIPSRRLAEVLGGVPVGESVLPNARGEYLPVVTYRVPNRVS
ncbi:MAG: GNAT family N-acetyltransferase [Candidatus Moranbacteria bacterium]|nr:GNAT family N-acetyltransferase [Candidatus Moranbacteria bacterium]